MDFRSVESSVKDVVVTVPEVDGSIVASGSDELNIAVLDVVSCNDGSSSASVSGRHIHDPLACALIVNLEALLVSLHYEEMLELIQVKHVFDLSVVLATLDWAQVVILDCIDKNAVFPHHSQLDDVVRKFDPLERFVIVHIDLVEQFDQVANQCRSFGRILWMFRQMLEHDFYEMTHAEAILATEQIIVIVNAL